MNLGVNPRPIVCDMSTAPDTGPQRLAEYDRLFSTPLLRRERRSDGIRFRLRADHGVEAWVWDLAAPKRPAARSSTPRSRSKAVKFCGTSPPSTTPSHEPSSMSTTSYPTQPAPPPMNRNGLLRLAKPRTCPPQLDAR